MSWVIRLGQYTHLSEFTTQDGHTASFTERTAMKFPSEHHAMMYLMGVQEYVLQRGCTTSWIFKADVVPCGS